MCAATACQSSPESPGVKEGHGETVPLYVPDSVLFPPLLFEPQLSGQVLQPLFGR